MILLYHKIYPEPKTEWWVTPNAFYLQMHDLQNKKVVYLDDYDASDPDQCVITFDGVYDNLWKYAVPILQHFRYPFELFIVGGSIGQGNEFDTVEPFAQFADEEVLQKMVAAGGRLQWHTWSHPVLVGEHSEEEYQRELGVPGDIRALDPNGFKWFAFPHGRRDEALIAQSRKYFRGALACDDGDPLDVYDMKRTIVFEKFRFSTTTVSLIIPCYNYGHLAAEAIESALYQIYPPDEILFIDDSSSDRSVEVAKRYEPHIRVEVNPKNLGVVENFKKAVGLTTGDYICFLGADNRFRSDYVEKGKSMLDVNPNVAIAYTYYALFGDRAPIVAPMISAQPHPRFSTIFLQEFPANPTVDIKKTNYIHGSSMYRRAAYESAGGYSTGHLPEDHSLFARMLEKGWKAKLVAEYVLEYRQHSKDQINLLKALELENAFLRSFTKENRSMLEQNRSLLEQVESLTQQNQSLRHTANNLAGQISAITNSRSWRAVQALGRARMIILPPGSTRERLAKSVYQGLRIWKNEGFITLIKKTGSKLMHLSK
jgi:glycosyltransferase involved in cell wall biosynthesis